MSSLCQCSFLVIIVLFQHSLSLLSHDRWGSRDRDRHTAYYILPTVFECLLRILNGVSTLLKALGGEEWSGNIFSFNMRLSVSCFGLRTNIYYPNKHLRCFTKRSSANGLVNISDGCAAVSIGWIVFSLPVTYDRKWCNFVQRRMVDDQLPLGLSGEPESSFPSTWLVGSKSLEVAYALARCLSCPLFRSSRKYELVDLGGCLS